MQTYSVRIEGVTPLLHHKMTQEELMGLLGIKAKKKKVKEEMTPREIADKHAYKTDTGYCIPMGYISGAFAGVASDYKQINSPRKSYKSVAGGVFRPTQEFSILKTKDNKTIKSYEVDIKKATNHRAGAVAVCRPRFDDWSCEFDIAIDDDILPQETALQILEDAGRRAGIGSFRVSKGGYYGQFAVTKWKELK